MRETERNRLWQLVEPLAIDWLTDHPTVGDDDLLAQIGLALADAPEATALSMQKRATRRMARLLGRQADQSTLTGASIVLAATAAILCSLPRHLQLAARLFGLAAACSESYYDGHQRDIHNIISARLSPDRLAAGTPEAEAQGKALPPPQTFITQNYYSGSNNNVINNSDLNIRKHDRRQD